ncbi:uncharacterized protein LOC130694351 [Daphnia carinata]|uniref:uncharacterized protein LOC130694351 n=1 Tax=Daphnia carinata TaxID=120202 RepID=UPI00257B8086|nr:uncharacterized protein LOC130694351 [Daphnia carinata]
MKNLSMLKYTLTLFAFALAFHKVAAELKYGECTGLRLDNSVSIRAGKCVALGGKCCDMTGYMIDDPRTMKATDKCFTCYNPDVTVKCTGRRIRSKPAVWGVDANSWITAAKCISLKGGCCQVRGKSFNPNDSPNEFYCNDCYAGAPAGAGCSGKLLASVDFSPKTCIALGGRCCDGDFAGTSTGSAFCPWSTFSSSLLKKCNVCYTGVPVAGA